MKSRLTIISAGYLLLAAAVPSLHAQVSLKVGNTKLEAKASSESASQAGANSSDDLKNKVKSLQDNIQKATDRLRSAGKSSAEQTKALDAVAQEVQGALKEVSPNGGGMWDELQKRIKETDGKIKAWQDKSLDTKISGEMQQRYNALAQKLSKSKDNLYKSQIQLDNQRVELQKRLQSVNENKEYVAELLSANDLEEANKAVQDVVQSMSAVSKTFDDLLSKITAVGGSEKTQ